MGSIGACWSLTNREIYSITSSARSSSAGGQQCREVVLVRKQLTTHDCCKPARTGVPRHGPSPQLIKRFYRSVAWKPNEDAIAVISFIPVACLVATISALRPLRGGSSKIFTSRFSLKSLSAIRTRVVS
jgi:hypothetical protein